MRTIWTALLFVAAGILAAGCGGGPSTMTSADTGDIPAWYAHVPTDSNYIYAVNTATSQDMQLAYDKATTAARAELGRQVEVKVSALQKRFEEETGVAQDAQLMQQFTQATKTVVSTTMSGTQVKDKSYVKDGNIYRAYVLVEYPLGAANAALLQAIKQNELMYTRFRASQAYKDLDQEAKKYEDQKKEETKKTE
jgi:hypothetical protein